MPDQERLDARTGQHEAAQRPDGDHVGDRRLAEQDRNLAEEFAAAETGPFLAVDRDRRLALEDHVEPGARQALAEDPLALDEHRFLEGMGDALELRRGQVGEQCEARRSRPRARRVLP